MLRNLSFPLPVPGRWRRPAARALGLVLLAGMLVLAPAAVLAQESGSSDANDDLMTHIDEALEAEIQELSDLARGRTSGPIENVEDLNRVLPEGEGQLGYNAVTSDANPVLSDDCHQQAMKQAIVTLSRHEGMTPAEAVRMGHRHLAEREAAIEEGEVTYADYIEHIAECKAFCGPLIKELIGCHVAAVRNLDHDVVFFPLDSYEVIGGESERAVAHVAERLNSQPDLGVLLIGRASRIGNVGYNRRLSGLRAAAVGDALTGQGVASERVKRLTFGYEPPQIDQTIADAYGYGDLYSRLGNQRMNQSVLLVLYPR